MAYTLTTKSQVTLPKAIREHLQVAPGDAVSFKIAADGSVRVEPVTQASATQTRKLAAARRRFGADAAVGSDLEADGVARRPLQMLANGFG